jgi:SM-20-related protein
MRADFFKRFGFFAQSDVLSTEESSALREEMASAAAKVSTVAEGASADEVDEGQRSSKWAQVSDETRARLQERFVALKPALSEHFGQELTDCQPAQFLIYREGDFFGAHHDSSHDEDAADFVRERRISVVLFVNGTSEEPAAESFGGGALTFYGLMGDSGQGVGLPVDAEPGLAVAFPSETLHGVSPVTHGQRFTVVTWFH